MKLSNTLVAPLAAILIVTGAGAVLATTSNHPVDSGTVNVAAAAPTATPAAPTRPAPVNTVLKEVLDGLVAKGTITADQETAILDGVTTQRTADKAANQALRTLLKQILTDGVITQDELNQLPANSPLRNISKLMTDGKISISDLRKMGFGLGLRMGVGGRGFGMMGGHPAATATPAP